MGFMINNPLGKKNPRIIITTNKLMDQLWQEMVMLRYLKGKEKVYASKSISPWIDQAKTYFLDASRSDWRSAGLLYYYSFLNLAKALLVVKKLFTFKSLNTISIYHGLRTDLQDITNLTDFEFEILPAKQNNRNNIFPYLYKAITNQDWPFPNVVTVRVGDIAAYCEDISFEMFRLFKIKSRVLRLQSLLRINNNQVWFEMAVPTPQIDIIKSHFPEWNLESIDSNRITEEDKMDWLLSVNRPSNTFGQISFLRSPKQASDNVNTTLRNVSNEAASYFEKYAWPNFHEKPEKFVWDFYSNITLSSSEINWHPVLSDYLMAFVLSSILRYQPQLLRIGTPNWFIAESWCSQSALTALRYFLAMFTYPPLHIETY
jgi:hypothetical protein